MGGSSTIVDAINFVNTASSQRIEPGSVNLPPAPWPAHFKTEPTSDQVTKIAANVVDTVNNHFDKVPDLFLDSQDGFWRDHLALTWDLRTLKGKDKIRNFLQAEAQVKKVPLQIQIDESQAFRKPQVGGFAPVNGLRGIQFFITFTSQNGKGRGVVRLVQEHKTEEWKIWTFFLTLDEYRGHPEPKGPNRPKGVEHGGQPGRMNWAQKRQEEINFTKNEPDVLILGCGQGGLTAAARLKMLGVSSLIIDRNPRIGDNWRNRYHQLVLHDPVWYDHLPYLPFPDHWPIFTPKDKLADWFDSYAKALDLNVWLRSTIVSSEYDNARKSWKVVIRRSFVKSSRPSATSSSNPPTAGAPAATQVEEEIEHMELTVYPKHIIQCTGGSGKPNMPTSIPGITGGVFKGDRLCHSSQFTTATPLAKRGSKKAIVVGACNSSHDICQDFYERGYDVTMVQRSSTFVVSSSAALKYLIGPLYSEGGPAVEDADLFLWSHPSEVLKTLQQDLTKLTIEHDAELLAGLDRAGFKLDKGVDGAGLFAKYLQRQGGYYIDVGTSKLIVEGKIAVKSGVGIAAVVENGLKMEDGEVLEADEIVFATGYSNMRSTAREVFGNEQVGDKVGDVWGWNEEGEMRGIWTRSGHEAFWFHGGNLALARYYSRVVALQIKASLDGLL
ncbi:FAD/NAD(P)-binding domain-containing protein [Neurospora crassa]|uniref:Flavin-containing monooxygenase n=1 Tax=Neurospora crassa (strain ATCC 24698 / 74-OR23-1A / CBS 708.71 / DSM 1257 / FGSC 987) TaxID=367110 RepID=Q7S0B3_NEUCR|nr:flavin-containing monooxygenase [Neurospora crassa OR74A]EAA28753.1 flavin-containing monooxygenase [Neurospora crassa OR74A]KHE85648.1 FAD/NAD(P)-binding domain-containing protein [Neurospora crassa]|eukprot:XP_957989.1 flavin-containing monooxygenase [Neurospora crassa OR74A]